jgi:branched-chain amino acid transport system substrate-binding protein
MIDDKNPVVVGALYLLTGGTGQAATYGEMARAGYNLAIDEINKSGGINGRSVEVIALHEKEPDTITPATKLVNEGAHFLMGLDSSGNAESLAPHLPTLGKVLMITHAASPKLTGQLCSKFLFRCGINGAQNSTAGAILAAEAGHIKWSNIGPNYSFGTSSWAEFKNALQLRNSGVQFVSDDQVAFPALGATDYTAEIQKLRDSNPDAVWCSLWGDDLVRFVRQANTANLWNDFPFYMELGAAMEVLSSLGNEMPTGLQVGTRYWWGHRADVPANKTFVDKFTQQYGTRPSYNAQNAYVGLHLLAAAANEAKSIETDKVIEALRGRTYEAPMGPMTIRPEDHQAVVEVAWGKTAAGTGYDHRILDPIRVLQGDQITAAPDPACVMT